LNVEATTTIQQYEITLISTGRPSKLTLAYRSDPRFPQTTSSRCWRWAKPAPRQQRAAVAQQSGTAGVLAILSEAISSKLAVVSSACLGFTRFRVDPGLAGVGSTGSEQNAAARITVEQQIRATLTQITYVSNVEVHAATRGSSLGRNTTSIGTSRCLGLARSERATFGNRIKIKKRFR